MTGMARLLEPLDINGMVLPNRIAVPAMVTRLSGEDGMVNGDIVDRYVRYAAGRVGLIVVEATAIHGAKSGPLLRLSDDSFIAGHRELARRTAMAAIRWRAAWPCSATSWRRYGGGWARIFPSVCAFWPTNP